MATLSPQHRFYSTYQRFIDDSPSLEISDSSDDFFKGVDDCEFRIHRHGGSLFGSLDCDHRLTRHLKTGWFYRFRPNPSSNAWFVGLIEDLQRNGEEGTILLKGFVQRLNATPHEAMQIGDSEVLKIVATIMEDAREQPYSLPGEVVTSQFDGDSDIFKFQWRWAVSETALDHMRMLSVFSRGFMWGVSGDVSGTAGATVNDYDFYAFLGTPPVWRTLDENKNCRVVSENVSQSNIINQAIIRYEDEDTARTTKRIVYDKDSAEFYGLRTQELELWTMTNEEFLAFQNITLSKYATPAVVRRLEIYHDDVAGADDNFIEQTPPFPWRGRVLVRDEGGLVVNPDEESEVWETVVRLRDKGLSFEVTLGDPKDDLRDLLDTVRNSINTLTDPMGNESTGITRRKFVFPCPTKYHAGASYDEDALEPPVAYPDPDGWWGWEDVHCMLWQKDQEQTVSNRTNPTQPFNYYDSFFGSPTPPNFGADLSVTESLIFSQTPTNWMRKWYLPMMSLAEFRKNKSGLVNWTEDLCRNRNKWRTENAYRDDGTTDTRKLTGWGIRWPEDADDAYLHAGLQFHLGLPTGNKKNTVYGPTNITGQTGNTDYKKILANYGTDKIHIVKVTRYPYSLTVDVSELEDAATNTYPQFHGTYLFRQFYASSYEFVRSLMKYNSGKESISSTNYTSAMSASIVENNTFYMTEKGANKAVTNSKLFALSYEISGAISGGTHSGSSDPNWTLLSGPINDGMHYPADANIQEWYKSKPAITPYPKRVDGVRNFVGNSSTKIYYQSISNRSMRSANGIISLGVNQYFGNFTKTLVAIPFLTLTRDTTKKPITTYEYRVEDFDDKIELA